MRPKIKVLRQLLLLALWGSVSALHADDSVLLKYTDKAEQTKIGLLRDMKGKSYLPLMDLAQFYGVQVQFDSQTRRVSLVKGNNTVKLVLSQPGFMAAGPDDMSVPIDPVEEIDGQLGIPPSSAEDVFATILDVQVNFLPDQQALIAGGVNLRELHPELTAPAGPLNNSSAVPAANTAVGAPVTAASTAVPALEAAPKGEEDSDSSSDSRNADEPPPSQVMRAHRIIIDAGHGGTDAGAPGHDREYVEKEATLDIAKKVANYLKEKDDDLEVLMTRNADYYITLKYRTDFANSHNADLFVSIHCNSNPREGAHGTEIYCYGAKASNKWAAMAAERENGWNKGDQLTMFEELRREVYDKKYSRTLAEIVEKSIEERLGQHFRNIEHAPFYVLAHSDMPSILVETAFISNQKEENKLRDPYWRDNMAKAIAEGILDYKKAVEGNGENQEARR